MIQLSPSAVTEVQRLRTKQASPTAYFRLRVELGGCSGLLYTLGFDEAMEPEDQVWHCAGLDVVVDIKSLPLLQGLTLDYAEDLMGGGFRFNNPNASQSCGCGNSFAIAPVQP